MKMKMPVKIIYLKYSWNTGACLGEHEYCPKDWADYERVMNIIEKNPDEYEVVNLIY